MDWKLIVIAIAFTFFLLFFGCTQQQPSKTPASPIQSTQSQASVQRTSETDFFECLREHGVKMYSTGWCDPCYNNIENMLNGLSTSQRFKSEKEFEDVLDYFEKYIHVNCTPCQERQYTISQDSHGIFKLEFSESTKHSSECKALERSLNYENPECTRLHLNQFPTWISRGRVHSGMISIEALASLTNCRNIFG